MLDPTLSGLLGQLGLDASDLGPLMSSAVLVTIVQVIAAIPTARIAKRKGRSATLWVILALSFPLLPLLLVWLLPDARTRQPATKSATQNTETHQE